MRTRGARPCRRGISAEWLIGRDELVSSAKKAPPRLFKCKNHY